MDIYAYGNLGVHKTSISDEWEKNGFLFKMHSSSSTAIWKKITLHQYCSSYATKKLMKDSKLKSDNTENIIEFYNKLKHQYI